MKVKHGYRIQDVGNLARKLTPRQAKRFGELKSPTNLSDFGQLLRVLQKLRACYGGLRSRTFRFPLAQVESRLDVSCVRSLLWPSFGSVRQAIRHGRVLVNGKPMKQPSYRLRPGNVVVGHGLGSDLAIGPKPSHLEVDYAWGRFLYLYPVQSILLPCHLSASEQACMIRRLG